MRGPENFIILWGGRLVDGFWKQEAVKTGEHVIRFWEQTMMALERIPEGLEMLLVVISDVIYLLNQTAE